jgi:hypothetical protein
MYFLKGMVGPVVEVNVQLADAAGGVVDAAAAAGFVSGFDSAAAGAALLEAAPSAGAVAGADAPPLPLKSVAYQPEPFNWKPAAVTCFLKVGWWQVGQSCKGASEIFCKTSLANPQDSHL